MTIQEILGESEFNHAIDTDKPVLIDFMASWCAPCKLQTPILKEFQEERDCQFLFQQNCSWMNW